MITKKLVRMFASKNAVAETELSYPFDRTFATDQFTYEDIRFSEFRVQNPFHQPEQDHIHRILHYFQQLLNNSDQKVFNEYSHKHIHQVLKLKLKQFHDLQKALDIQSSFKIQVEKMTESLGFLQIEGWNEKLFMHECQILRFNKEKLLIQKRENSGKEKTAEDQLKQMKEEKTIKKQLEKEKQNPYHEYFLSLLNFTNRKQKNPLSFSPYYLIDRIQGNLSYTLKQRTSHTLIHEQPQIQFTTKWVYHVNSNEPEDIRKSRHRVLFDFQFWNRGTFIPVKNFVPDIQ